MGVKGKAIENRDQYGDSIDRVQYCLSCPYGECFNCLEAISPDEPLPKRKDNEYKANYDKRLSQMDKLVIAHYADDDVFQDLDIAVKIGRSASRVMSIRKGLGLPAIKLISIEKRRELVEPWMSKIL